VRSPAPRSGSRPILLWPLRGSHRISTSMHQRPVPFGPANRPRRPHVYVIGRAESPGRQIVIRLNSAVNPRSRWRQVRRGLAQEGPASASWKSPVDTRAGREPQQRVETLRPPRPLRENRRGKADLLRALTSPGRGPWRDEPRQARRRSGSRDAAMASERTSGSRPSGNFASFHSATKASASRPAPGPEFGGRLHVQVRSEDRQLRQRRKRRRWYLSRRIAPSGRFCSLTPPRYAAFNQSSSPSFLLSSPATIGRAAREAEPHPIRIVPTGHLLIHRRRRSAALARRHRRARAGLTSPNPAAAAATRRTCTGRRSRTVPTPDPYRSGSKRASLANWSSGSPATFQDEPASQTSPPL